MRSSLESLLASRAVVLADGATGTNYFEMGLESGEPPELWNVDHPENVGELHRRFVEAGADVILTNTFGCNRNRLSLHRAEDRVFELAKTAAAIARTVADEADRPIVVAGSVGPTGELFAPLGGLTHESAVAAFREQIEGLVAGGIDVAWIETMSAPEEVRAAATAAIEVGVPYTATCSFDTAGRTMMGLPPGDLGRVFEGLTIGPVAYGANCGVGAPDILVSLLDMTAADPAAVTICKGNCGVPRFAGTEIVYTGTPQLMGRYAALAAAAGARVVGGCCGTSPEHLAAMRAAIDRHDAVDRPDRDAIVAGVGPLTNTPPREIGERGVRARSGRRSSRQP
ncbi:MAG TPA: betaine--homocysteine S-methyltransferase [Desertimonas sp.]|nr:betaine--homocysteine S-methyltransferase [Desertimonas sp.]